MNVRSAAKYPCACQPGPGRAPSNCSAPPGRRRNGPTDHRGSNLVPPTSPVFAAWDLGSRNWTERPASGLVQADGTLNLRPEQSNIFFKLMEERYGKKATIITTNLAYEDWYAFLGNKEMVGALLDRLRHHCTTIHIDGESLRQPTG